MGRMLKEQKMMQIWHFEALYKPTTQYFYLDDPSLKITLFDLGKFQLVLEKHVSF